MTNFRISRIFYAVTGAIVLIVLFGWAMDIENLKSGFTGLSTMKPNTALGLGMLGLAASREKRGRWFAIIPLAIALTSLGEDFFHFDLGIDDIFRLDRHSLGSRWAPGRPSPVTSLGFLLIGVAIILPSLKSSWSKPAQALLLVSWIISFQSIVSFSLGMNPAYGSLVFTQMAIHTALGLLLVASGLLLSQIDGIMRPLRSSDVSGKITRTLLFFSIFFPPAMVWVQDRGVSLGLWDADFGVIFRIISQVIFFSWLAFKTGVSILVAEETTRKYEKVLKAAIHTRDEFLSIASHELRTPLTSMKLQLEIAQRSLAHHNEEILSPGKVAQMIENNQKGLHRMVRLVEDMLDISRIEEGKLLLRRETVDFKAMVEEVLGDFYPQFEAAKMDYRFEGENGIQLNADRLRLEQVITNLFTNAIRYAPNGPLTLRLYKNSGKVHFELQDSGPGIAREHLDLIFKRFEKIPGPSWTGGLGLGLYIARNIAQAHGGTLRAESRLGKGTSFLLELPT